MLHALLSSSIASRSDLARPRIAGGAMMLDGDEDQFGRADVAKVVQQVLARPERVMTGRRPARRTTRRVVPSSACCSLSPAVSTVQK